MKKIITLILGLCLCFVLIGCGGSGGNNFVSDSYGSESLGFTAPSQNENIISYDENTGLLHVPLLEKENIDQILTIKGKKVKVSVTGVLDRVSAGHLIVNDFNVNKPFAEFTPETKSRLYYAKAELDNGKRYLCKITVRYY